MIVFDLECQFAGHRFEGWFASSGDFARQQETGLLACPQCGSADVKKAPMAPNLGRKGNQIDASPASVPRPEAAKSDAEGAVAGGFASSEPVSSGVAASGSLPPQAVKMMKALAKMQEEALKQSRWVGDQFVEQSRAMHYGEKDAESIHGEATLAEAQELLEEGIELAPLPFPIVTPGKSN